MIEKGLILTGNDAELLSQLLEEIKTKVYAESEVSLDNSQALATRFVFQNWRESITGEGTELH